VSEREREREGEGEGRNLIDPKYGAFGVHLRFLKVADEIVH
jgi:hypothetical protein